MNRTNLTKKTTNFNRGITNGIDGINSLDGKFRAHTNRQKDEQDYHDSKGGQGAATNREGDRAKKHGRMRGGHESLSCNSCAKAKQNKKKPRQEKRSLQRVLASSVLSVRAVKARYMPEGCLLFQD
jgi:hypothetical protein